MITFDDRTPFCSVRKISATFQNFGNDGVDYLAGVSFEIPDGKMNLGYTEANQEQCIAEKARLPLERLWMQTKNRGIKAIKIVEAPSPHNDIPTTLPSNDSDSNGQATLLPAAGSTVCGYEAVLTQGIEVGSTPEFYCSRKSRTTAFFPSLCSSVPKLVAAPLIGG